MLISNVVGALNTMCGSSKGVVGITNNDALTSALDLYGNKDELEFLWIDCEGVMEPTLAFWMLAKNKALSSKCRVVFTNAGVNKPGLIRAWQEFTQLYCGTIFGSLYLMEYNNRVKPQIVSSMKGIYS